MLKLLFIICCTLMTFAVLSLILIPLMILIITFDSGTDNILWKVIYLSMLIVIILCLLYSVNCVFVFLDTYELSF